jgi:hypothetical protein
MEGPVAAQKRWEELHALQAHYRHFDDFLRDAMDEIGFGVTELQADIADYMEHGPDNILIEAQRSQAKTTIAACFCVWSLIHKPSLRVLILSAAGGQASDISTLIVRLIMFMDVLECMRPDRQSGDRASTEAFDVHHSLKGVDKSPSVKCLGITANLQGNRADLLLADDIESAKNAMTPVQRAQLEHLTKDFTSIVQTGRIIWLGTPQTGDSIYNGLPARGVAVRIWPGRYPTVEQMEHYSEYLAPMLRRRIEADPSLQTGGGITFDQGKPTDPQLLDEVALQKKERDQGTPYFQLQHMLNTVLLDKMRFPLKPELLVTIRGVGDIFPLEVVRGMELHHKLPFKTVGFTFHLTAPHETSRDTGKLHNMTAYVDPAAGGANGDETAYAIGGMLNSNIVLVGAGGIPGGYDKVKLEELAARLVKWKITRCIIEKNMGYGAFAVVFSPILQKAAKDAGIPPINVDEDLVTGQKEVRIINTLAPVMGRGSLVINPDIVETDEQDCMRYEPKLRQSYSLFFQLAKISSARGALVHDDRVDALEGLVRAFQASLAIDQTKAVQRATEKAARDAINLALRSIGAKPLTKVGTSMLRHRRR